MVIKSWKKRRARVVHHIGSHVYGPSGRTLSYFWSFYSVMSEPWFITTVGIDKEPRLLVYEAIIGPNLASYRMGSLQEETRFFFDKFRMKVTWNPLVAIVIFGTQFWHLVTSWPKPSKTNPFLASALRFI